MEQFFGWLPMWVAAIVSWVMLPGLIIAGRMTSMRLSKAENFVCTASMLVGGYGFLSLMAQATSFTS